MGCGGCMKYAFGMLLLLWLSFLTIVTSDLYYRFNETERQNEELVIMIREFKEEIAKRDSRLEEIINQNQEKVAHDMIVHEQMVTAQIKGMMKEW